jgi:hypothetical protein
MVDSISIDSGSDHQEHLSAAKEETELSILDIFKNHKEPLPTEIEVIGAGVKEVNGVYVRSDDDDGCVCLYTMDGSWKNKPAKFEVRCCYDNCWIIRSVEDPKPENDDDDESRRRFYFFDGDDSSIDSGLSEIPVPSPPTRSWRVGGKGIEPVPIIHWGSPNPYDWRLFPETSRSDWKIVVQFIVKGVATIKTYHVHRNTIALGCKASGYFARLCESRGFPENEAKTSHIELHATAAERFPILLDYMYGESLRISRYNAIILLYLANYFDCKAMRREVKDYCNAAMKKIRLVPKLYKQASKLEMFDVMHALENFCLDNLEEVLSDSNFIYNTPPRFWVALLSKVSMTRDLSTKFSVVIAKVLFEHEQELVSDNFYDLTQKLSHISHKAASRLLEFEAKFIVASPDEPECLSPLQIKCIKAMAECLGENNSSRYLELPPNSPAILYKELLKLSVASTTARMKALKRKASVSLHR